jgi:hypothetical protein
MVKKKRTRHVDKKILIRAKIFAFIAFIFIVILLRDLYIGTITLPLLLGAEIAGVIIGIFASRMFHMTWDEDGKKVIATLDGFGIIVLTLYIFFAIFREQIVGVFVHGPMLSTVTIAVMGGIFIGQIISIRNGVAGILKDEGISK